MRKAGSLRSSLLAAAALVAASCTIGSSPNPEGYQDRLTLEVTDTGSKTVTVSVTADRADATYLLSCVMSSEMEGLEDDELLTENEKNWREGIFKKYSWEEIMSLYGGTGSSSKTFTALEPETDYTIYVYCVDEKSNVTSKVSRVTVTTKNMGLHEVGTCVWHDVFACEYNSTLASGDWTKDMEATLYEQGWGTGVYVVDTPYSAQSVCTWYGLSAERMAEYENIYWKKVQITFDCSDPQAVSMPYTELGLSLSNSTGWISAGSTYGTSVISTGKLENAVISFPAGGLVKSRSLVDDGKLEKANLDGGFTVSLYILAKTSEN